MNFNTYNTLRNFFDSKESLQETLNEDNNFDWLDESIFEGYTWAFVKSPVKSTKLFANHKKLTKALIDKAKLRIDLENRLDAATGKNLDSEKRKKLKEKIQGAHDLKKEALTDTISGIKQRMDDLSSGDSKLQQLASNLKTKSELAAAEKLLKIADGKELEDLKIKIKKGEEKLSKDESDFDSYDSTLSDEEKKKGQQAATKAEKEIKSNDNSEKEKPKKEERSLDDKIEAAQKNLNIVKAAKTEHATRIQKIESQIAFYLKQLQLSKDKREHNKSDSELKKEIKEKEKELETEEIAQKETEKNNAAEIEAAEKKLKDLKNKKKKS